MTNDSDFESKAGSIPPQTRGTVVARRIRNWAARQLPSWIDTANTKQSRAYYREKDVERIPASIPSSNQNVSLKQVFAAEFYTPAHAEQLFSGFKKLGWDSARTSPFRTSSEEWATRSRKNSGGMWLNLGTIVPPGSKQNRGVATSELPEGFSAARAEFLSVSPSLSCIIVTFESTSQMEARYEEIARSSVGTRLLRIERGHSITPPGENKRRMIAESREGFRSDILKWFKSNLPGAFSASGNLELFPTGELLFVDGFRNGDEKVPSLWRNYLGLDYGTGHWESSNVAGLMFAHPVSHDENQKGHSVIYAERSELRRTENALFGGDGDEAYLNRLSIELPGFVGHWGLSALLRLYQEELSVVRDGSSSARSVDAATAIERLQRVTSNSIDISLFSAELPDAFPFMLWSNCDFTTQQDGMESISLAAASRQSSMDLLERLGKSDRAIRDLLVQQGNLISAMEGVRTQRNMSKLTVIMTALTVVILLLTALMAVPVVFPKAFQADITSESE
ncbi:hypothetical protein ELI30_08640 [Rhizobium leguminosarum]|uniref:hypothetical protein n=1 Tax=Rhizobium leguminosarum TaxID=384 RepID=UPI00102F7CF9|nr:hypothetical protein [Rhizobium leguminosarum]TAV48364.1 hypothetical protein ELI32_09095 [Rhizobium leguminosarum]TAV57864.1 hypothetical protein ELI31_08625 [Rhizobium leguminosarum]TAV68804.1 hypothetical protein ELI30_08640 [Rhizobium leguminosarum]